MSIHGTVSFHLELLSYSELTRRLQGNFLSWHRYFTFAYENALRKECGYTGSQPVRPSPHFIFIFQANILDSTGTGVDGQPVLRPLLSSTAQKPA